MRLFRTVSQCTGTLLIAALTLSVHAETVDCAADGQVLHVQVDSKRAEGFHHLTQPFDCAHRVGRIKAGAEGLAAKGGDEVERRRCPGNPASGAR